MSGREVKFSVHKSLLNTAFVQSLIMLFCTSTLYCLHIFLLYFLACLCTFFISCLYRFLSFFWHFYDALVLFVFCHGSEQNKIIIIIHATMNRNYTLRLSLIYAILFSDWLSSGKYITHSDFHSSTPYFLATGCQAASILHTQTFTHPRHTFQRLAVGRQVYYTLRLSLIYAILFSDWLSGGKYITHSDIHSSTQVQVYSRIYTSNNEQLDEYAKLPLPQIPQFKEAT